MYSLGVFFNLGLNIPVQMYSALLVIQGCNDSPSTAPPGTFKGHPFTSVALAHRNTKTAGKLISSALTGAFKMICHCRRTFYHLVHVHTVCGYSGRDSKTSPNRAQCLAQGQIGKMSFQFQKGDQMQLLLQQRKISSLEMYVCATVYIPGSFFSGCN